jgi:hypothetical protein
MTRYGGADTHMKGARRMHGEQQAIDRYMAQLARQLDLPVAERDATLLEIRSHLEELATARMADGASAGEAQRQALAAFGDVRRVGQTLSTGRLIQWGRRRWVSGVVTGALLTWVIWTAGTFLVQEYYFTVNPVIILGTPIPQFADPLHTLLQSTPLTGGAFYAYLTAGWAWLLPLLLLYALAPFLWGHRARQWWAPGLAYGLGTWLAVPWALLYPFLWNTGDWGFTAEAWMIFLALPLALLASLAGVGWQQWRESRLVVGAPVAA